MYPEFLQDYYNESLRSEIEGMVRYSWFFAMKKLLCFSGENKEKKQRRKRHSAMAVYPAAGAGLPIPGVIWYDLCEVFLRKAGRKRNEGVL